MEAEQLRILQEQEQEVVEKGLSSPNVVDAFAIVVCVSRNRTGEAQKEA